MTASAAPLPDVSETADDPEWPKNRRGDSRTDRLHSLRNLLRIRARKFNLPMIVLGNSDDMLIAASEENMEAESALMKASKHSGRYRKPDAHLDQTSHRFRVGDQELVLVATGKPTGAGGANPGMLERVLLGSMAERIRRIFNEPNAPRPRGDEGPIVHDSGRNPRSPGF